MLQQSPEAVVMVKPACFVPNAQTESTNHFQLPVLSDLSAKEHGTFARHEFELFSQMLSRAGVVTLILDDDPDAEHPDAVFPNNWASFHDDGTLVLYPLEAENRRTERQQGKLSELVAKAGFHISRVVDLSLEERHGRYLEGTGSIVFDHQARLAFACHSTRTDQDLLTSLCTTLGYDAVMFRATDVEGLPIYHTNVLLSIGSRFAICCADAITDMKERERVLGFLSDSGRDILLISMEQLHRFAGNVYEITSVDGHAVVAMSTAARRAFTEHQFALLSSYATIVEAPLEMIERGGGSARCMLLGVHLPKELL